MSSTKKRVWFRFFGGAFLVRTVGSSISCRTKDVQSIRVDIKEGLNPRRALYLRVKDRRDVPLTRVGTTAIALSELENQGAELARFLGVPLEGL
jgi:hypothetical protein